MIRENCSKTDKQPSAVITRSNIIWYDVVYNAAIAKVEYKSEFDSIKYASYPVLMGEQWGTFTVRILKKIDRFMTAPHCIIELEATHDKTVCI